MLLTQTAPSSPQRSILVVALLLWLNLAPAALAAPDAALRVNQTNYGVGDAITYNITGAPANAPILWSSWKDGVPTGERDANYGHRTDARGQWSATAEPWEAQHIGWWKKQASVGGRVFTVTFRVTYGTATAFTSKVGIYSWGQPETLAAEANRLVAIGGRNLRLRFPTTCPETTLTQRAQNLNETRQTLDNPNISTYVLTAYDAATGQSCDPARKFYLDPSQYNEQKTAEVEAEYKEFTLYLYRTYQLTGKRFIIAHWEGDNAVYCTSAYGYATDRAFRQSCQQSYRINYRGIPTPNESLRGLQLWLAARQRGISAGRAEAEAQGFTGVEVFHALEFNLVRALRDAGLKSVLYDVAPAVNADFVSYSAYESTNVRPNRLADDLDTIERVTGTRQIIIGEFGFDRLAFHDAEIETRTGEILDAALGWGVAYVFSWVLSDTDGAGQARFGLFDAAGRIQPIGAYYQRRFQNR